MKRIFWACFSFLAFSQAAQATDFCTVQLDELVPGVFQLDYVTVVASIDCTDEVPQQVAAKMRLRDSRVFKSISTVTKMMDSEGWSMVTMSNTVHNRYVLVYQK